jgi:hypothetical protein
VDTLPLPFYLLDYLKRGCRESLLR